MSCIINPLWHQSIAAYIFSMRHSVNSICAVTGMDSWDQFTYELIITSHIQWKHHFALTLIITKWLLQNWTHDTATVLSWHVIWWPVIELQWCKFSITLEFWDKIISEEVTNIWSITCRWLFIWYINLMAHENVCTCIVWNDSWALLTPHHQPCVLYFATYF